MNNRPKINAAKYTVYVLIMAALYVLQSTPGLLAVSGIKPNLVIPAAVAIAVCEGEFIGGVFGTLAGILCDYGAPSLFGFNAMILLVCCVAVGLLTIYLLRPTVVNFMILLAASLLIRGLLDYLLNFYMWGYENVQLLLTGQVLPGILYSLLPAPLAYLVFSRLYEHFEQMMEV